MPQVLPEITEAFAYLGNLEDGAAAFVQSMWLNLVDDRDAQQELGQLMKRAAELGWFDKTWKRAASAYMFVAMVLQPMSLGWESPDPQVVAEFLKRLKKMKKTEHVNRAIIGLLLPDGSLNELVERIENARSHVSRLQWQPSCFTNPNAHDPANYRYIINGMIPSFIILAAGPVLQSYQALYGDYLDQSGEGTVVRIAEFYLRKPESLRSVMLSCSLIDQDKHKTYKNFCFGYILRVPEGNILKVHYSDMNVSTFQNMARGTDLAGMSRFQRSKQIDEFLDIMAGSYHLQIRSPDAILLDTPENGHNEVLVVGSYNYQGVTPAAIFIKVHSEGDMMWEEFLEMDEQWNLSTHIKACAKAHSIPIVHIRDDRGTPSEITFNEWRSGVRPPPRRDRIAIPRALAMTEPAMAIIPIPGGDMQLSRAGLRAEVRSARINLANILGTSASCGMRELTRAFGQFALRHHPDRSFGGNSEMFIKARDLLELIRRGEDEDPEAKECRLLES